MIRVSNEKFKKDKAAHIEEQSVRPNAQIEMRECTPGHAAMVVYDRLCNGDARKTCIVLGLDVLLYIFSSISNSNDPYGSKRSNKEFVPTEGNELDGFNVHVDRYESCEYHSPNYSAEDKRVKILGLHLGSVFKSFSQVVERTFLARLPIEGETKESIILEYRSEMTKLQDSVEMEFNRGFISGNTHVGWTDPFPEDAKSISSEDQSEVDQGGAGTGGEGIGANQGDDDSDSSDGKPKAAKKGKFAFYWEEEIEDEIEEEWSESMEEEAEEEDDDEYDPDESSNSADAAVDDVSYDSFISRG